MTISSGEHTNHPVDRPNPQLGERDVLRTLGTDRILRTTSKVRRFLLHYAELQVPMALGALVCYLVVTPIADSSSVYRPGTYLFAAGDVLFLTIPVVAWMIGRGHSTRHSLEMGIAMLAPVAAIVAVGELAGFDYLEALVIAGYPALSLGMLVYMLQRRQGSDSGSIGDGKVASETSWP